jgi:hypothetical protein
VGGSGGCEVGKGEMWNDGWWRLDLAVGADGLVWGEPVGRVSERHHDCPSHVHDGAMTKLRDDLRS